MSSIVTVFYLELDEKCAVASLLSSFWMLKWLEFWILINFILIIAALLRFCVFCLLVDLCPMSMMGEVGGPACCILGPLTFMLS